MTATPPPLSDEQYAAIRARREAYQQSHSHMNGFACCSAHASADDVPALLAEVDRLRAELAAARAQVAAVEAFAEELAASRLPSNISGFIAQGLRERLDAASSVTN